MNINNMKMLGAAMDRLELAKEAKEHKKRFNTKKAHPDARLSNIKRLVQKVLDDTGRRPNRTALKEAIELVTSARGGVLINTDEYGEEHRVRGYDKSGKKLFDYTAHESYDSAACLAIYYVHGLQGAY